MRFPFLVLLAGLGAVMVSCKSKDPIRLQPTIEDSAALANVVRVSDPASAGQLLRGFFNVQSGAWRWTGPQFAVRLGSPTGADTRGARLVLDFNLPGASIATLKNMTVAAKMNGLPLPPETYTTPGDHQYQSDVPASAFAAQEVTVEFSVDKFLTPPNDGRNLALIVTAIALESK